MQMWGFLHFPLELSVHANMNLSHFSCICYHSNISPVLERDTLLLYTERKGKWMWCTQNSHTKLKGAENSEMKEMHLLLSAVTDLILKRRSCSIKIWNICCSQSNNVVKICWFSIYNAIWCNWPVTQLLLLTFHRR